MRITGSLLSNNMMRNLQNNIRHLDKINNQLASGKEFSFPSQNPIGVANSMRFNNILSVNDQYLRNINRANDWLSNTEGVLNNMGQTLQRARELVVYSGSSSLSEHDKIAISEELKQLRAEMISLSNAKMGDDYIFAGQKSNISAFSDEGVFLGDNRGITREIGPGIMMTINSPGERVFKGAIEGLQEITYFLNGDSKIKDDIDFDDTNGDNDYDDYNHYDDDDFYYDDHFNDYNNDDIGDNNGINVQNENGDNIEEINDDNGYNYDDNDINGYDDHYEDDYDYVNGDDNDYEINIESIDDALIVLDDMISVNLKERAEIGAKINRLELSENRLQDVKHYTTELLSKNEDVDIADKITELKLHESIYNASLAISARIIQPTLMDFLR